MKCRGDRFGKPQNYCDIYMFGDQTRRRQHFNHAPLINSYDTFKLNLDYCKVCTMAYTAEALEFNQRRVDEHHGKSALHA